MSDETRTVTREDRRLAVEAFLDAHYDVACDAARELAWFEAHPDQAVAVVAVLAPAALPTSTEGLDRAAIEYVTAERAYWASLSEHDGWSDERKQAEMEHDPEAWFAPWDRRQVAALALGAAVDARLASLSPSPTEENP